MRWRFRKAEDPEKRKRELLLDAQNCLVEEKKRTAVYIADANRTSTHLLELLERKGVSLDQFLNDPTNAAVASGWYKRHVRSEVAIALLRSLNSVLESAKTAANFGVATEATLTLPAVLAQREAAWKVVDGAADQFVEDQDAEKLLFSLARFNVPAAEGERCVDRCRDSRAAMERGLEGARKRREERKEVVPRPGIPPVFAEPTVTPPNMLVGDHASVPAAPPRTAAEADQDPAAGSSRHPKSDLSPILGLGRNEHELTSLVKLLKNNCVLPFVGAGVSIPSGYPGWTDFILELAAEAGITNEVTDDLAKGDYESAAQRLEDSLEPFTFGRRILQTYGTERPVLGAIQFLPRLVRGPVLTTNFDQLLERAFHAAGHPFEERVWGSRFDAVKNALFDKRHYLIKIHGDAKDSSDRVLTAREYDRHYAPGSALSAIATAIFSSSTLLFVGCSLSFDRTMRLFAEVAKEHRPLPEHYAIVEMPGASLEKVARQRDLARRRIVPIWYPNGEHSWVPKIVEYLVEQVSGAEDGRAVVRS